MRRVALAAAAALAAVTVARLPAAWESGNALNHVSGVWMTLAHDLAGGTLYRPLHAETGAYGGTRYFPLVFSVHAALVRAGAPLVGSGEALSLAAGLLLVAALAALLRALGASRANAWAGAAVALAGFAAQHALAAVRGDLLPVALSAAGLALVARPGAGAGRVAAAGSLLVLAFAAKPTSAFAAVAAAGFLALRGERTAARGLGALATAGGAAVVLATDALSSGRFLAAVGATATAGAGARALVAAPIRLAETLAIEDPAGLALTLAALAVAAGSLPALLRAARGGPADPRLLPALWVLAAWASALLVFATPGTGVNHLVELEAASAALLGAAALAAVPRPGLARAAAAAAALAGVAVAASLWRQDRASSRLEEVRAVVRALPPGGPVVSEDPLVPLLAGASPLLLDPFALRVAADASPAVAAPLALGLRRGVFPAVVLLADLDAPDALAWYAGGNLGLPLVSEIRRGYRRAGAFGRYHLYLPRDVPRDAGVVRSDPPR